MRYATAVASVEEWKRVEIGRIFVWVRRVVKLILIKAIFGILVFIFRYYLFGVKTCMNMTNKVDICSVELHAFAVAAMPVEHSTVEAAAHTKLCNTISINCGD